jgi:lycopene beta-cyclase
VSVAYEMLEADDFYSAALAIVDKAAHIDMLSGTTVGDCKPGDENIHIETSRGMVAAQLVFDSRPRATSSKGAWIQAFQGIEVETTAPVFDPARAMLMDFSVMTDTDARAGRVHFMYVLPKSATCALIEDTWFMQAADRAALPDMEQNIRRYLAARFGVQDYVERYREQGALQMDGKLRPVMDAGRYHHIGAGGGMARASSGYAFFDTQRASDAIVRKLGAMIKIDPALDEPFSLPGWRSRTSYWMDAVFLRALQVAPEKAPALFFNLFRRVPPAVLARFLSGVGTTSDVLRVVAACPKLRFIRAGVGW